MYGTDDPSRAARLLVTALHAIAVAVAAWILFGSATTVGARLDITLNHADLTRRALLLTLSVVYFGRVVITTFVTLKRTMTVAEAVTVGSWLIIIHSTMAVTGSGSHAAPGWATWLGVVLYALGSYLNTGSELQRLTWKKRPENRGKLYTGGLFKFSMHPNYLGDVTLFIGFALATGTVWAFAIPTVMAAMFVFINIPMLDKYLAERYGQSFQQYAARTAKLIPLIY